jgi:hypothetical protein
MDRDNDPKSRRPKDPVGAFQKRIEQRAALARNVGAYGAIPIMMVIGPVAGWLGGSWLERRFGFAPWLSLGGLLLGGAASVRQIALLLSRATKSEEAQRKNRWPKS